MISAIQTAITYPEPLSVLFLLALQHREQVQINGEQAHVILSSWPFPELRMSLPLGFRHCLRRSK